MTIMIFRRIFIFTVLFPSISEGCAATIPPEEYYPTSTLPDLEPTSGAPGGPGEEPTTVAAPTTGGGGGGTTCECNDLPPGVTQEFLDTRIKDEIDKAVLPEAWKPTLISCGLQIQCAYSTSDESMFESRNSFLVTAAADGGEDPIILFENAQLYCLNGVWTNNGQKVTAMGCYATLK
ncbi:unnamed protein product [Caenorhabditis brenneri]